MSKRWPDDLSSCKNCNLPKEDLEYKLRGLCVSCFRKVKKSGNLRSFKRYSEDRTQDHERRDFSVKSSKLIFCVRNIGVGEVAKCLSVSKSEVRDWLQTQVPEKYEESVINIKKAIQEESYEFFYPEAKIDPWNENKDVPDTYGVNY